MFGIGKLLGNVAGGIIDKIGLGSRAACHNGLERQESISKQHDQERARCEDEYYQQR